MFPSQNGTVEAHDNEASPCALTTLLYSKTEGLYLIEKHLERLKAAHTYLHSRSPATIKVLPASFEKQCREAIWKAVGLEGENRSQRVRALLTHEGQVVVSSTPLSERLPLLLDVCLDTQPTACDPGGHKTTRRQIYHKAQSRVGASLDVQGISSPFDVLMWNVSGFITETGVANVAFELPDAIRGSTRLVTPRQSAGLVTGVMRQHLLDEGMLVEGDVTLEDAVQTAKEGRRIVAFNAVRKMFDVHLVVPSIAADKLSMPYAAMGVGVVIDCYDSYTNNILPYLNTADMSAADFEAYLRHNVAVLRLHSFSWSIFRDQILPHLDWIIISPGPGRPDNAKDFGFCAELLQHAQIPILGICLGHQGIAYAHGAQIIPSSEAMHGRTVNVHNTGIGIFEGVPVAEMVRYNSLCVDPHELPSDITVTAWSRSSDGSSIEIMGLQHKTRPQFGVQFHLESTCSDGIVARMIMHNFARIVARSRHNRSLPASALPAICKSTSYINFEQLRPLSPTDSSMASRPLRLVSKQLNIRLTPAAMLDALNHLTDDERGRNVFWLDSARYAPHDPLSRFSFLGLTSRCIRYENEGVWLTANCEDFRLQMTPHTSFWDWLSSLQAAIHCAVLQPPDVVCGFRCGLVGYFAYEMGKESLDGYGSSQPATTVPGPLAEFMLADQALAFDHRTDTWHAMALINEEGTANLPKMLAVLPCTIGMHEDDFHNWVTTLQKVGLVPVSVCEETMPEHFHFGRTADSYKHSIHELIQLIGRGESYEMNLTGRFTGKFAAPLSTTDAAGLYMDLRARNAASYSSFMSFSRTGTRILSTSPELFIQLSGDEGRDALMKPIKGTLRRTPCSCTPCVDPVQCGTDRAREDTFKLAEFEKDPKERAENLMIVDLIKADLQNFCHTSSVKVSKLMDVEASETVYSLVSSVEGKLVSGMGPVEAIRRSFPPGSMTGAPKLRTVELLEQLEDHEPRGVYSGCLGYLSADNKACFNVVIRTLVIRDTLATVGAGGAITWLSDAEKEWEEVLLKARSVLQGRV